METIESIKLKYPLHYLVWENQHAELETELAKKEVSNVKNSVKVIKNVDLCIIFKA